MNVIRDNIQNSPNLPPPFKKFEFDTLKVNKMYLLSVIISPLSISRIFRKSLEKQKIPI